jgi:hypothetical protein
MDGEKEIPKSTHHKIIIPVRDELFMFEKKTYIEPFMSHIISKIDYDNIISVGTRVMGEAWSKKRNTDVVKIPRMFIVLSITSVLLTFLYMIFIFLSTSNDSFALLLLSIFCVSFASLIAFSLSIYNFRRKLGKFMRLEDVIREDVEKYLQRINIQWAGRLEFSFKDTYLECSLLDPIDDDKARRVMNKIDTRPLAR